MPGAIKRGLTANEAGKAYPADLGGGTPAAGKYLDGTGNWVPLPTVDLTGKLTKPATPSAPAVVTLDASGNVTTTPLTSLGGAVAPDSIGFDKLAADVENAIEGKADAAALTGYVPVAQALAITDNRVAGTGNIVFSTPEGALFALNFVGGVLQADGGGTIPPPTADYEADVDRRWASSTLPTGTPSGNLWPASKPTSGGPTIHFDPITGNTAYAAAGITSGHPGLVIANDWVHVDLGGFYKCEPDDGKAGVVAAVLRNLGWDSSPTVPDGALTWALQLFGRDQNDLNDLRRVQVALRHSAGVWSWGVRVWNGTADVWVAEETVEQTIGTTGDNAHGITVPFVMALKLAGPDSALVIASTAGTQQLDFDLTGIGDYKHIYYSGNQPGPLERGFLTLGDSVHGADGFTDAKIAALAATLGTDNGFTVTP